MSASLLWDLWSGSCCGRVSVVSCHRHPSLITVHQQRWLCELPSTLPQSAVTSQAPVCTPIKVRFNVTHSDDSRAVFSLRLKLYMTTPRGILGTRCINRSSANIVVVVKSEDFPPYYVVPKNNFLNTLTGRVTASLTPGRGLYPVRPFVIGEKCFVAALINTCNAPNIRVISPNTTQEP